MRRISFWKLKTLFCDMLALCCCALFCVGIAAAHITRFGDRNGERTFYLYSASSQGLQKNVLRLSEIDDVSGESVRFSLDGEKTAEEIEAFAKNIAKRYGAEICFCERVGGVTSYYAYTPRWQNFLRLSGVKINLHIAISAETAVIGSPIIFGGF